MKVKLNGNNWYEVTSDFGEVSNIHPMPHTGLDLSMPIGTELRSPVDGVVKEIVDLGDKNIGKGIFIETEDGSTVIMGHLSDYKVELGQKVSEGQIVGLSGNTGNSTGAHLHLGLKDEDGSFINPEQLVGVNQTEKTFWQKFINTDKIEEHKETMENSKGIIEFINDWRTDGFWVAMYDKPFSQVIGDFLKELFRDLGIFILGNGDLFFLAPAIIFMFGTFLVGKNKLTKWIIPLWFAYFVSSFFHRMMLAQ